MPIAAQTAFNGFFNAAVIYLSDAQTPEQVGANNALSNGIALFLNGGYELLSTGKCSTQAAIPLGIHMLIQTATMIAAPRLEYNLATALTIAECASGIAFGTKATLDYLSPPTPQTDSATNLHRAR